MKKSDNMKVPFPMRGNIYGIDDIISLLDVLNRYDNSVKFETIRRFETLFADYAGAKHAISLTNATAALHIGLKAIGIEPGDEVITTPISWVASSNVILVEDAKPVFADIESDTLNIDPESVAEKITSKTKVIIPVHYAGHPVDMDAIMELASDHNIKIIDDAAHAIGAEYKGKRVGSIGSDISAFSFHSQKNISTLGEGGMAVTMDDGFAAKIKILQNHGVQYLHKIQEKAIEEKPWYRDCVEAGYNYRMSEGQAAVGISQLNKVDRFNAKRRELAEEYTRLLKSVDGIKTPIEKDYARSSWHLYVIQVEEGYGMSRDDLLLGMGKRGIGASVHYTPIYLFLPYQRI